MMHDQSMKASGAIDLAALETLAADVLRGVVERAVIGLHHVIDERDAWKARALSAEKARDELRAERSALVSSIAFYESDRLAMRGERDEMRVERDEARARHAHTADHLDSAAMDVRAAVAKLGVPQ